MRNKYFLLTVVLVFVMGGAGCTSKKVDSENSDISELTGDSSDSSKSEIEEIAGEEKSSGGGGDEDFGDDSFDSKSTESTEPVASGETNFEDLDGLDEMPADKTATDDLAATSTEVPAPVDATSDGLDDLAASGQKEKPVDTSAALGASDETQGLSDVGSSPKPVIPLQKMVTTPYKAGAILVNALYIARDGDTTKSVAKKIYGEDKSKELKKINPTLARRSMKVGDKVYYNSPQRPNDSATLLTYYEDMGLAPEVYLSQTGDNIRTVAKTLLGNDNSWKEVWATNTEVESKGELQEGTRLRYWSSAPATQPPAVATTTAADIPPPPVAQTEAPPMPEEVSAAPPPPVPNEPPPIPEPAAVPPPPPPVAAAIPPPPPQAHKGGIPGLGEDPDQMMALGAGAILLLAAIFMFVIIKKKRAKRNSGIDFQTATHTQIE